MKEYYQLELGLEDTSKEIPRDVAVGKDAMVFGKYKVFESCSRAGAKFGAEGENSTVSEVKLW